MDKKKTNNKEFKGLRKRAGNSEPISYHLNGFSAHSGNISTVLLMDSHDLVSFVFIFCIEH